jgi:hypothetical protein
MASSLDLSSNPSETNPTDWPAVARKVLQAKTKKERAQAELNEWVKIVSELPMFAQKDFERFRRISELTKEVEQYDSEISESILRFYTLIPSAVRKLMSQKQTRLRLEDNQGPMEVIYDNDRLDFDVV